MMQSLPSGQHELYASLDEMLSPETLSELLHTSVRDVRRSPLAGRGGVSNNVFEWVTAVSEGKDQRYVLKRIQFENDWLMIVSNDILCRSVTLWQYGLLNKLSSHLDHTIIACSHDDAGWAILMKDVSAGQHPVLSRNGTPSQIHQFLDALAFMHATYWQDDTLAGEHLGLNDNASLIGMTIVPTARNFAHLPGPLAGWILEGWDIIQTLLEPDAFEIYHALMQNPQMLYDAVDKYPATLTHGDYRSGISSNLSYMTGQPIPVCVFDWQFAGYALMTVDMAWFVNNTSVRAVIAPHDAAAYYRERLEHHLGLHFNSDRWQAMLELGLLADALRAGCFGAFFLVHGSDEESPELLRAEIDEYNDQIRAGARWL